MSELHSACLAGDLETANSVLLDKTIDVNQYDNGMTALHIACSLGFVDIVKVLLSRDDIDLEKKTDTGFNALNIAFNSNHKQLIDLLTQARYRASILDTRKVPRGQDWLMARMTCLGYKIDEGICCGVARMAKQAFLVGKYEEFTYRLIKLNIDFTPEAFTERLRRLEQEIEDLLEQATVEPNSQRKEILLKKIQTNRDILIDIHSFFTGIALHQNPERYAGQDDVFNGASVSQDDDPAASWLSPTELDNNPIVEVVSFSGAYAHTGEIKDYLDGLESYLGKDTFSLSLNVPGKDGHAIELSYSPQTKWILTDANGLPGVYFEDTDKLSKALHKAFVDNIRDIPTPQAFFRTILSCTQENERAINEHMELLQANPTWSKIHSRAEYSQLSIVRMLMEKGVSFSDLFNLSKEKYQAIIVNPDNLLKLINKHISFLELEKCDVQGLNFLLVHADQYIYLRNHVDATTDISTLVSFMKNFDNFPYLNMTHLDPDKLKSLINNQECMPHFMGDPVAFLHALKCSSSKFDILISNFNATKLLLSKGVSFDELNDLELDKLGIITSHSQALFILMNQMSFNDIRELDAIKIKILLSHSQGLISLIYHDKVELSKVVVLDAPQLQTILTNNDPIERERILESLLDTDRGLSKI